MTKIITWILYISIGLMSIGIWVCISYVSGKEEAWDSKYYFVYGLPLMIGISGILGYAMPIRPWRWGVAMVVPQILYNVPGIFTSNLFPLGIFCFVIFAIPCISLSYLGANLRRRVRSNNSSV